MSTYNKSKKKIKKKLPLTKIKAKLQKNYKSSFYNQTKKQNRRYNQSRRLRGNDNRNRNKRSIKRNKIMMRGGSEFNPAEIAGDIKEKLHNSKKTDTATEMKKN